MAQLMDKFDEFIADADRRRLVEREALAFEASELISQLMEAQDINKTELAEKLKVSKSHITQLLSGSRNMTMYSLADLAFALGHKVEMSMCPLDGLVSDFEGMGDYEAEFGTSFDFGSYDYSSKERPGNRAVRLGSIEPVAA